MKNRHLLEVTRALLFTKNVPKRFWGESILTCTYLINRLPTRVLNSQTPIASLQSFYPNWKASHLEPKIFGCISFIHNHSPHKGKLDPKAIKCMFLVYSTTQKGYKPSTMRKDMFGPQARKCAFMGYLPHKKGHKLYDMEPHYFFTCRDVIVDEQSSDLSNEQDLPLVNPAVNGHVCDTGLPRRSSLDSLDITQTQAIEQIFVEQLNA
ncbi:hypothetical protein V2J09_000709 [Rumex salicifolius]